MRKHLLVALLMFGWMLPAIPARLCGASVNLRTEDAVPFEIHMTTPHVASAPVKVRLDVRYDVDKVIGGVCIVVDGDEYHTSCWEADGLGARQRRVEVLLEHRGEYAVQMLQVSGNGKRQSNVEILLLQ